MRRRMIVVITLFCLGLLAIGLVACTELGYYTQATQGQLHLLWQRRPIAQVLADPAVPVQLKERLTLVLKIRDFASQELLLPENGSYRCYADLGRPHVVWNVVATPEFSLEPLTWTFPVAGCVSYRGYFNQTAAEDFAAGLQGQGSEVDLYGVTAYSTLGWFDDPVLNTFVNDSEPALAGMIFHELAHQKLYVKDDSSFSEAFAELVEQAGVERWLGGRGLASQKLDRATQAARRQVFIELLQTTRRELVTLYASAQPIESMRGEKQRILAELEQRYRLLRDGEWQGYTGFDRWFERPVNNARLAAVGTYHDLKPALAVLLKQCNGNLALFYAEADKLAQLPREKRRERLATLEEFVRNG